MYTCKLPGNSQHILDGPWRPAVTLQGARFGMCSKNLIKAFSKYVHEAVETGPPPASPPRGVLLGREQREARLPWPPHWYYGASLSRLALKGSSAGSRSSVGEKPESRYSWSPCLVVPGTHPLRSFLYHLQTPVVQESRMMLGLGLPPRKLTKTKSFISSVDSLRKKKK